MAGKFFWGVQCLSLILTTKDTKVSQRAQSSPIETLCALCGVLLRELCGYN